MINRATRGMKIAIIGRRQPMMLISKKKRRGNPRHSSIISCSKKGTDMVDRTRAFNHVGLLFNWLPKVLGRHSNCLPTRIAPCLSQGFRCQCSALSAAIKPSIRIGSARSCLKSRKNAGNWLQAPDSRGYLLPYHNRKPTVKRQVGVQLSLRMNNFRSSDD